MAVRRHGIVTAPMAADAGVSERALRRRAVEENWPRLHHGVWALPGSPDTPLRDCAAALAAAGPQALVARRSAAWLWELRPNAPVRPEVLVANDDGPVRRAGLVALRTRTLTPEDAVLREGMAVTTPARTLADMARVSSQERLLEMVVTARQSGLVQLPELAAQVGGMSGSPGIQRLRRAVELLDGERVDSLLERELRRGLGAAGFPKPDPEPLWLGTGPGRVQIDIAWPDRRVGIEVDGFAHHHTAEDLARDHRKNNVLAAAGWVVLRIGYLRWQRERAAFLNELRSVLILRAIPAAYGRK